MDGPALEVDQLAAVTDGLGDHGPMVWLGAVLGLRWGEVAALTVDSFAFLHGTIDVTQQLGRNRKLSGPKSLAGRRTLAAPASLLDGVAALLASRGLTAAVGSALVFANLSGGPLNYSARRRTRWREACTAGGVPGLRFHDLRWVAASAMAAAGVDVKPRRSGGWGTPMSR